MRNILPNKHSIRENTRISHLPLDINAGFIRESMADEDDVVGTAAKVGRLVRLQPDS